MTSAGPGAGPGPPEMDLATPHGPLSHLHLLNHDVMTGNGPGVTPHSSDVLLALLARNKSLEGECIADNN